MAESTHKMETPMFSIKNTYVPVNWCAMCQDLEDFSQQSEIKYCNLKVSNFLV